MRSNNNHPSSGDSHPPRKPSQSGRGEKKIHPPHSDQRSLRDYLLMIRERWLLGLVSAAVIVSLLAFHRLRQPDVFEAKASLLFEVTAPQVVDIQEVVDTDLKGNSPDLHLQTHVEQVKSTSFYNYVETSLTEAEVELITKDYLEPGAEAPSPGAIAIPGIDASLNRGTYILTISARHRNPEAAVLLANRYATSYIDFNRERTSSGNVAAIGFLEEQEAELRQEMNESEAKLQEYQREHNLVSLEENQNIVVRRLNTLSAKVADARIARLDLDSQLEHVNDYLTNDKDLMEVNYIATYGSVPRLRDELETLKTERALLNERYLERHPKVVENTSAIENIEAQLKETIQMAVTDLLSRHRRAVNHEKKLEEELAAAEQDSLELEQVAVEFNVLQRQVEADRQSYSQIVDRLNETRISSQLDHINIKPVDTAGLPEEPVEPNLQKIILQSAFLGGLILFGLPLGLGLMDQKLKAAWEVETLLGLPLLGEIPKMSNVKRRDRAHIISKGDEHSACEAFRGIFSQLQMNTETEDPQTILITSTVPGEGKSVVACNLATTFATHGRKTLLVDCDFRRPALHHYYERKNDRGILRWFDERKREKETINSPDSLAILRVAENLHLLRTGGESRNPTAMFETAEFKTLLKRLKGDYDTLLIDTPPVGIFPDSLLLAGLCDQILYVCQFNRVNKTQIRKLLETVKQTRVEVPGLILNGLPIGRSSAYYEYFGYGQIANKEYKAYYSAKR